MQSESGVWVKRIKACGPDLAREINSLKNKITEMRVFELEDFRNLYNASHEVLSSELSEEKREFLLNSEEVKDKIVEGLLKNLSGGK